MPSALSVVQYCSMLFSIVQYCDLLNAKRQKACKGTTKNAHTQIFLEKNVFLDKNYAYGLHLTTVASGECANNSFEQSEIRMLSTQAE